MENRWKRFVTPTMELIRRPPGGYTSRLRIITVQQRCLLCTRDWYAWRTLSSRVWAYFSWKNIYVATINVRLRLTVKCLRWRKTYGRQKWRLSCRIYSCKRLDKFQESATEADSIAAELIFYSSCFFFLNKVFWFGKLTKKRSVVKRNVRR